MRIFRCILKNFIVPVAAILGTVTSMAQRPGKTGPDWFAFQWQGATISGRYFDKAAIIIPVKVNDFKGNNVAQFDLGSDETVLYGNTVRNHFASSPAWWAAIDTASKIENETGAVFYRTNGIRMAVGRHTFRNRMLMENYGSENPTDSLYTASPKIVGTIGADVVKDKVLIIDYPHKRMAIADVLDKSLAARTHFIPCKSRKNRIRIPLTVDSRVLWFMFDTGSSIFPIATEQEVWKTLVDTRQPADSMKVNSWGKQIPVYGADIIKNVYLGDIRLEKGKAWYHNDPAFHEFFKEEEISGFTGNAYFLQHTVVIDFKKQLFGIVK